MSENVFINPVNILLVQSRFKFGNDDEQYELPFLNCLARKNLTGTISNVHHYFQISIQTLFLRILSVQNFRWVLIYFEKLSNLTVELNKLKEHKNLLKLDGLLLDKS